MHGSVISKKYYQNLNFEMDNVPKLLFSILKRDSRLFLFVVWNFYFVIRENIFFKVCACMWCNFIRHTMPPITNYKVKLMRRYFLCWISFANIIISFNKTKSNVRYLATYCIMIKRFQICMYYQCQSTILIFQLQERIQTYISSY